MYLTLGYIELWARIVKQTSADRSTNMRAIGEEQGTNRENRNLKEMSKIRRGRDFCDTIAGGRQEEVAQNTALELKGSPLQEAMSALESTKYYRKVFIGQSPEFSAFPRECIIITSILSTWPYITFFNRFSGGYGKYLDGMREMEDTK